MRFYVDALSQVLNGFVNVDDNGSSRSTMWLHCLTCVMTSSLRNAGKAQRSRSYTVDGCNTIDDDNCHTSVQLFMQRVVAVFDRQTCWRRNSTVIDGLGRSVSRRKTSRDELRAFPEDLWGKCTVGDHTLVYYYPTAVCHTLHRRLSVTMRRHRRLNTDNFDIMSSHTNSLEILAMDYFVGILSRSTSCQQVEASL